MSRKTRGGAQPEGLLSRNGGEAAGTRRGIRGAVGVVVSTMLVAVGTVGVGVMPAHAAEEKVSDWVCDTRDPRATNFLISNGTAQEFTIPKFGSTGLPGTFKGIEITQSADLKTWGSLGFYHNDISEVTVTASYDIWMNLPPYPAEKTWTDDSKKEIHDNFTLDVYHELEQKGGGTPEEPGTVVEVPEATARTSASATSADAAVWDGEGSHPVTMQARASFSAGDSGGNLAMRIRTTAAAEVCYRYTYEVVSIGDYVWSDTDRDGQQDGDEPGVPNVLVKLFEKDGTTPVQTATTNAQGYYAFKDLKPGAEYRVEFVKPDGSSFTLRNEGDDKTDSDPDAAGIVNVTAPSEGKNLTDPGKADDSTIDAGLVKYNLVLKKTLSDGGPYVKGATATFTLTPSNDGPVDALAGWSVTDLLPEGMTLVSMSGEGYTCSGATCVASAPLKAGATAKPITVKATVDTKFVGDLINVAYVAPSDKDIDETNPLVVPTGQTKDTEPTNTATSPTDNDASAPVTTDSLVSIGDYVWTDVNRDGVQDAAEPAVKGVVVNLYEADGVTLIGTTKTDDKGFYSFIDLTPGREYVVEFVKPEGYAFADDNAGDSDIVDSDADRVTGRVKIVAPASGVNSETDPDDPTIDAGLVSLRGEPTPTPTPTEPVTPTPTPTEPVTPTPTEPGKPTPNKPGLASTGSGVADGLVGSSLGLLLVGAVAMIVVRRRTPKADATWLFGDDSGE